MLVVPVRSKLIVAAESQTGLGNRSTRSLQRLRCGVVGAKLQGWSEVCRKSWDLQILVLCSTALATAPFLFRQRTSFVSVEFEPKGHWIWRGRMDKTLRETMRWIDCVNLHIQWWDSEDIPEFLQPNPLGNRLEGFLGVNWPRCKGLHSLWHLSPHVPVIVALLLPLLLP